MPIAPDLLTLQVTARRTEAQDVVSFALARLDHAELPLWTAGAHVDVEVSGAVGSPELRQYSLCGDPADRTSWRVAVLREPAGRGGSRYLHEDVQPGATLRVGVPRNNFGLVEAPGYVFVAGGIGITPLLPMIRAARLRGADWTLFYGARRRERMGFLRELESDPDRVRVLPEDECGLLPVAEIVGGLPADVPVYGCGPEPLLGALEHACAGRPAGSLHVERFSPRADVAPTPDRPFDVLVHGTGAVVRVAAGVSVLDALGAAGHDMPNSCREGTCASCETPVLDGRVEHRDSVLSAAERDAGKTMMICVSRALSDRLILDI